MKKSRTADTGPQNRGPLISQRALIIEQAPPLLPCGPAASMFSPTAARPRMWGRADDGGCGGRAAGRHPMVMVECDSGPSNLSSVVM